MTLVQSTPFEIRELDLDTFRLALKNLEDSEEGICFPDTHRHNTEVSLAGIILARVIEIINDYTITFEDGQYAVNLVGANSNVADKVNLNQVSVRASNSAGLIVVETGVSGLTEEESTQLMSLPVSGEIAGEVWDAPAINYRDADSFGDLVYRILRSTEIKRGTVQDDGASVLKFITDLTETANGFWDRTGILFSSGQCMGQLRGVKSYNGSTHELSVETPFSYAPARNDQFIMVTPRKFLAPNLEDIPPMVRDNLAPELLQISEVFALHGLNPTYPLFVSSVERTAGGTYIMQLVETTPAGTTVTRVF